jgi:hypothetical protein
LFLQNFKIKFINFSKNKLTMSDYQFPHQVLMNKKGIEESDLSTDAQDYLADFESYLGHLQTKKEVAEREGENFQLTDQQKKKLLRLSKSISNEIYNSLEEDNTPTTPKTKEKNGFFGIDFFS